MGQSMPGGAPVAGPQMYGSSSGGGMPAPMMGGGAPVMPQERASPTAGLVGGPQVGAGVVGGPQVHGAQPNIYDQAAGALRGAMGATGSAIGYNPGAALAGSPGATASGASWDPMMARGYSAYTGGNLPQMWGSGYNATGYDATHMGPADQVMAGQFAGTDMNPYMNPWMNHVVKTTTDDMERARQIEQNQREAQMAAAGSFGGSRHGIADAEANRNFYDRLGATTGNLRAAGFESARDSVFRDIGNRMQADLANQGANLMVDQFNAGASNRADEFSANAQNQAGMAGSQASIANAQISAARNAQIMDAINRSREFGASATNAASQFNSGLGADMSRFNAGLETGVSQFNAGLFGDLSRFNAGQINDYNQNRVGAMLAGGGQLGNLANLGFGMGNQIADRQMNEGGQAQAIRQAILNAAMQQFGGFTGAGNLGLGMLQQGVGASPRPVDTTQTMNPGLFGILGTLANL